jgi:hypothetical protein
VITSRSPLKYHWQDSRIHFVAVDFLGDPETIIAQLTPLCVDVTHAFFTSYVHSDDFQRLRDDNIPLFKNFLTAIDLVAHDSLQGVCLQTGGKVNRPLFERSLTNEISDLSSITVFTLGPSSSPAKNVIHVTMTEVLTSTMRKRTSYSRYKKREPGHTISSAPTPSSDLHLPVIHSGGASHLIRLI